MRENLLKRQPTWGLRRAQGTGQKSATPSTLTKIILVLLTTFLLPSAAWGQITVADIESTGGTIEGSGITGTVTFNAETSTLTLNGATIDGSISYSGTDALTIALIGENTMNCGSSSKAFVSTNEVSLSFSTNSTDNGSLTISDGSSYNFDASDISTFSSKFKQISCSEGSRLVAVSVDKGMIYVSNSYRINIGGVTVTTLNADKIEGSNISETGTVKYVHDAINNIGTLYLTDVTISETGTAAISIPTSLLKLTINIQGSNSIETTGNSAVIMCNRITGTNTVEFSGTGSLTLQKDGDPGLTSSNLESSYKDGLVPTYLPEGTTSLATATKAVIAKPYGLIVAGVAVTSANYEDILNGDNAEKVSFTPDNNILTLKSANITVNGKNAIESGLANLTVNLVGDQNVITCEGNSDRVFKGTTSGAIVTFTTDATNPGSLGGSVNQESYMFDGIIPVYQNGLNYWGDGYSFSIDTRCGIMIGNVTISSANVGSDGTITGVAGIKSGTVKFTPADNTTTPATPATLTLTNATLGGSTTDGSIESILDNLTINLEGTNTLYGHIAYTGTGATAGSLAFTGNGSLTLSNSDGVIYAFSDVDFEEFNFASISQGIHYNTSTKNLEDANDYIVSNVTIIKGTYYPIWVKGTLVTASNYNDVLDDGTVSFDPTGNKLSLDEATIDCSETSDVVPVASTIKDLEVYLSGINTVKVYPNSDEAFVYAGSESDATLTFSTVDPSDYENLGMLTINNIGSKTNIASGYAVKGLVGETSTSIDDWGNDNYNTTDRSVSGWKLEESNGGDKYVKLSYREVYDLWISSVRYCSDKLYNNVGDAFDPKTSTLTLTSVHDSYYNRIYSGLPALTINIGDENELEAISFGSPNEEPISAESGTLTITGKEDSESSSSINSLSLSNSDGGVITGFSSVDLTLPMHVSYTDPYEFTGWTSDVTYATITDETDDDIFTYKFRDGINYVTFYSERDLYLSDAYTPAVITEISGSTVKTQALSYIPKKTPVLVSKAKNTATTATFSKNLLKYAESSENPVTASESKVLYVLYNDQFVKVTPGSEIYYGGYLDLTGVSLPANTRGLSIDGIDGTSAIDATIFEELNTEGDAWYDLQGRRIAKPTKAGLYIINGKKVVLK